MNPGFGTRNSVERERLRESGRIVGKIEALLLACVLLSLSFAGVDDNDGAAISMALFLYGALVAGLRYAAYRRGDSHWTIAVETWAMIPFVTWAIWYTDKFASPLLNAYLVIVITSALTLGMRATLWQLGLIAACFVLLSEALPADAMSAVGFAGSLLTQLTPLIVVAYVTSVFSADIRFWMNRSRLRADLDPVTGLYSMRGFAIATDRIFARAARNDTPVSVLLIDAGDLVRQSAGPAAANGALRSLATGIASALRQGDALVRRGESEFVALLAEASEAGAREVAGRIRAATRTAGAQSADGIRIGVAGYLKDDRGIDAALMRAEGDVAP